MNAPHVHPDAVTLSAYHDGELRGVARAEVDAHLATCRPCRRALEEIDHVTAALRALPMVDPPEVHDAVLARGGARPPRRRARGASRRRPLTATAAILAALVALVAGYDIVLQTHGPALAPSALPAPLHSVGSSALRSSVSRQPAAHGHAVAPNGDAFAPLGSSPGSPPRPNGQRPNGQLSQASTAGRPTPSGFDGRLIARTGAVDLRVPDVQRAFHAVTGIAAREGGYVSDSLNNATAGTVRGSASLTLRIPAANFQATLDRLAALPHDKLAERSSSLDVTDSYHNLQAQLQALQATRAQLLALMHRAGKIGDAMAVLDRLTAVDASIDGVQGQIMASANSVMLSTITVNLTPQPRKGAALLPSSRRQSWQPGRTLADALGNLGHALQAIITVAIYVAVYLALPALIAVPVLLGRRLRRRST